MLNNFANVQFFSKKKVFTQRKHLEESQDTTRSRPFVFLRKLCVFRHQARRQRRATLSLGRSFKRLGKFWEVVCLKGKCTMNLPFPEIRVMKVLNQATNKRMAFGIQNNFAKGIWMQGLSWLVLTPFRLAFLQLQLAPLPSCIHERNPDPWCVDAPILVKLSSNVNVAAIATTPHVPQVPPF